MSLISIIVPIYRVEEYLSRCIQSILNQTYKQFELILIDDGSPDQCPELCDEWAKKDDRIKVIHKENGGLSDARNAGMQIASGEFIVFVDSDDWVAVNYLEDLMSTMKESGCDIVECDVIRTEEGDLFAKSTVKGQSNIVVFKTEEALEELIEDGCLHQYVWNKLYKRNIIHEILFVKGKTNEDEFWTYQVFGNAEKIAKIDIPLYYYFQRSTSIMGTGYSLKRLDALEAKIQRQAYIEERYPRLKDTAQINLFTSCIYQGQMALLNLKNEQLQKAKEKISAIANQSKPTRKVVRNLSVGTQIWISAAKFSFWWTCRIKNFLKKGL